MEMKKLSLLFPMSAISLAVSTAVNAQDNTNETTIENSQQAVEEVVVLGRLRDAAGDLVLERLDEEVVSDIIGADAIGRIGDTSVGAALRRVPGVTLVDGRFVYVRGLGERYSSTYLNGAVVPSPDLTRNVVPLDIFPTTIVDSLSVQKTFSSDMGANFGGGAIDIRTKAVPDDLTFSFQAGTSYNSASTGKALTYNGGGDDFWGEDDGTRGLNPELSAAVNEFRGNFNNATDEERRQLGLSLNRDMLNQKEEGVKQPLNLQASLGNNFALGNTMEFGVLSGVSYRSSQLNRSTRTLGGTAPSEVDELVTFDETSIYNVNLTGFFNTGLELNEDNVISTTSLFLRNTDDEVSDVVRFTQNRPLSEGFGNRNYQVRYEQQQMIVNQIRGEHELTEDTRDQFGLGFLSFLDGLKANWYYSDATSTTDIPSETNLQAEVATNPSTGEVTSELDTIRLSTSAAQYRFTDLEDDVLSYGWELAMPVEFDNMSLEFIGGFEHLRKARTYKQLQFNLGTTDNNPFLSQGTATAFSDNVITDADNGFTTTLVQSSEQSYIAANVLDATYGKIDATFFDTWRATIGVRYEDFVQVSLPWNPIAFDSTQISTDVEELENSVFMDDTFYPSLSLTYMNQGFMNAEDFQVRFGYSETVQRPDLREVTDGNYIDPITDAIVFGNADVTPANLKNYDLRAEWFFESGDNFTVSAFHKDIENPIEFFEQAAADENIAFEIINAESGSVSGLEFEFLKDLGNVHEALSPFFISGNLTLADSEIIAGDQADAPTNASRPMQGASEYAVNTQLGFDSDDGNHAAMLSYNVFGERLFYAGRNGNPDAFEQPFHSVDMTYSYFPTDSVVVNLKLKNLLDQKVTIQERGVEIFEREVGTSASLSIQYNY